MELENLRAWHWMVIGVLAGLLYGAVKQYQGPWYDTDNLSTMDQPSFEREIAGQPSNRHLNARLTAQYLPDQPLVKDLVVHPPLPGDTRGANWVTGKMVNVELLPRNASDPSGPKAAVETWQPFKLRAPIPYKTADGKATQYPTIVPFLDEKLRGNRSVTFRYAWWEKSAPTILLPAAGGLLIVGIAWPLTISLMMGVGLAKPAKRFRAKLPAAGKTADKAAIDHSAGDKQLAELNAQLDKSLAGFGSSPQMPHNAPAQQTPAKALGGGEPTVAAPKPTEETPKEYGGEFYPVARTTHKKE